MLVECLIRMGMSGLLRAASMRQGRCAKPAEPRHAQPVGEGAPLGESAPSQHTQHVASVVIRSPANRSTRSTAVF